MKCLIIPIKGDRVARNSGLTERDRSCRTDFEKEISGGSLSGGYQMLWDFGQVSNKKVWTGCGKERNEKSRIFSIVEFHGSLLEFLLHVM